MSIFTRYLEGAGVVPRDRQTIGRVGRSMWSSAQKGDTAALPVAVGFDVSDACNLACAVCSREIAWDKRDHAFLRLDRFIHAYDQIRPPYVSLSGYGETLLNRDLAAIVAHATQAGSSVQVISNGTLLDPEWANDLLDAGLARLKVSVDGATPASYRRWREGGELEVVLRNVEKLIGMRDARRLPGPRIELQMVLFEENVGEAEALLELVAARFAEVSPTFLVMFTYGEQPGFAEKTLRGDPATLSTLSRARQTARRLGFARAEATLAEAISQLTTDLSAAPCYLPWFSAMISTDGDVYPCCYHTIRGVKVGNVFERPFAEIWNGPEMVAFRQRLRTRRCDDGVCATCRYQDDAMEKVFAPVRRVLGR